MPVYFHTEDVPFRLKKSSQLKSWIKNAIKAEGRKTGNVNYIFCFDEYLLGLNRQYLKHDIYTDIITFDNSSNPETIEGDIFISIERVKNNAQKLKTDFDEELHRVMIHGILHLLGYDDKKASLKKIMRKKEDEWLKLRYLTRGKDNLKLKSQT